MDRKGSKRSFSADITSLNDSWKRSRGADHGFSALDFRKPALLLTCAPGKEALAVKDLSAFLEEEIVHSIDKGGKEEVEEVKGNTVSSALEEELRSIRDKEQQKANIRGFWKQKSGSGIAFLQFQDDAINLTRVVDQVFTKLKERKESFSRSLFKIIPLHKTCFSSSSEVENMINAYLNDESVKRDFENKTFAVLFKKRGNQQFSSMASAKFISEQIRDIISTSSVNLKSPDVYLVVEIADRIAGVTHISKTKYDDTCKFNIQEFLDKLNDADKL